MEATRKRIRKVREAIERQFSSPPSVIAWKRMCDLLSEYVFIAIQLQDDNMHQSEEFRKAIGYLIMPPKRAPQGMLLEEDEWMMIKYYVPDEVAKMNLGYGRLVQRLAEWAADRGGDEECEVTSGKESFARSVWRFYLEYERNGMAIFKTPFAKPQFRPYPFEWLVGCGGIRVIKPSVEVGSVDPMVEDRDAYREETLECLRRTAAATEMIAGDAIAEGQSRKRVGTPGEVEQENEILRRVRANGGKGLRGFTVTVLNNAQWQFRDGHAPDPQSVARCYNRCYALLHPARRHE